MKLSSYLKDKSIFIFFQGLIIILLALILSTSKINFALNLLMCFSIIFITIIFLAIEYIIKMKYYNELYKNLKTIEKKQYIASLIEDPNFNEGKILYDILKILTKAMNDEISSYKISQDEYREYIETWIHEIKLPISCISLICENNKNNEITKSIYNEVLKIDSYVEQTLYYAKITNLEKDYNISTISLNCIIKSIIKKHSKQLIECKTKITLNNLDFEVYSDTKWLDFILGQIIANSIKYRKDKLSISFFAIENNTQIILYITDNGVGISKNDLLRVFDKGFTGQNGRKFAKSTGMGLYICKKLCEKIHIGIDIESDSLTYTTIKLIFPKDKNIIFNI